MVDPAVVDVARADATAFRLIWYAPATPGAPVFVVVPAMGVRARFYRRLAVALAAYGHGVAVSEQRGHEEIAPSRPGRRRDFGYAELTDDLDAAVGVARARAPGSAVIPIGHSLGAHVACLLAARRPERIDGLVLVAAGSVHWPLWPWYFLPLSQAFVLVAALVGHFPGHRIGFAGREARGGLRDWGRLARTGRLSSGRPPRDAGPALAGLDLPVLAVSVEGDPLAPAAAVDRLAALLPSADRTRQHVAAPPGAAHFSWAREPRAVADTVHRWAQAR